MKINDIKQTIQAYDDGLLCYRELVFKLHENLNQLTLELLDKCNSESPCYSKENLCSLFIKGE